MGGAEARQGAQQTPMWSDSRASKIVGHTKGGLGRGRSGRGPVTQNDNQLFIFINHTLLYL